MYRRLVIFVFLLFSPHCVFSQFINWITPPTYHALEVYDGTLYKIREGNKVGLADVTGKVLVAVGYDSITPFTEHLALALEYTGGKYKLKGIIAQDDYALTKVPDGYYIPDKYAFFSEGKLAVYDDRNKYGYLTRNGSVFKGCQYIKAYPFYWGRACVQVAEKKISYLKDDGTDLTTELESETYTLLTGSSFNEKKEAYVQAEALGKGIKRCIIDLNGKNIREAKYAGSSLKNYNFRTTYPNATGVRVRFQADGVTAFCQNGLYGFSKDNRVLIPAQFTWAEDFRGGYARAEKNNLVGILKLGTGLLNGQLANGVVKVKNMKAETARYVVLLPEEYADKSLTLLVKDDQGDVQESISNDWGNTRNFSFTPVIRHKEKKCTYHFTLYSKDFTLWEDSGQITFEYIENSPPVVYGPLLCEGFKIDDDGYVRADNNNKVDVHALVENKATEEIAVTVTIGGEGVVRESRRLVVPPLSHASISTSIEAIKERKQVVVFVETSDGVRRSNSIKVKPFI